MKRGDLRRGTSKRALEGRHRGPKIRNCAFCGEEFNAVQEFQTYRRKYCSPACTGKGNAARVAAALPPREEVVRLYEEEGLSDVALGKLYGHSYQWAFKLRQRYGIRGRSQEETAERYRKPLKKKSDRARWAISLKPEEACRNCGVQGCLLHLHHSIPRSTCRATKYDLRNGVPLCTTCHLGWHNKRVVIYRDVFTAEEWAYLSSVELTGRRIEAWLDDHYPERPEELEVAA